MSGWRFNNSRIGTFEFADIDPWSSPSVNVDGVWNTDRFYNTDAPSPVPPVPQFPVSNSQVEWAFDANALSGSIVNLTANSCPNPLGITTVGTTTDWYAALTATRTAYTTTNGYSSHYITAPADFNLMLGNNSWDPTAITNNGGFTVFAGLFLSTSLTGWGRIWNYFGSAPQAANVSSATGSVFLSSTNQYANASMFGNKGSNRFQIQRVTSNTSAAYQNLLTTSSWWGSNVFFSYVHRYNTDGTADVTYRVKTLNSSVNIDFGDQVALTISSSTNPFGIDSVADTARPVIIDSVYSGNPSGYKFVTFGFANRPYGNNELTDLADFIMDRFG